MPAVNTLIIHRADMFGLAQLYQLRGRVGRGKQRGYAYLTWPADHRLSAAAQKRLEVMQTLDNLGAGFTLASPRPRHPRRRQPAGRRAVRPYPRGRHRAVPADAGGRGQRDQGGSTAREVRGGHAGAWTPNINLGLPVLIPETYVRDLPVRLGLYRRIGALQTEAEIEAMAAELADRFGTLPQEVENLLQVVAIKALCRGAGVEKVDAGPKGVVLSFLKNRFRNPAGLVNWVSAQKGLVKLRPDHKLALLREMDVATRLRFARDTLGNLERISGQAKAA